MIASSNKRVWWKCKEGHEWSGLIVNRPRQGEGQAGLLSVLLREEEAREADKARLALGPSARKEWGGEAGRRLLPIGVILRVLD